MTDRSRRLAACSPRPAGPRRALDFDAAPVGVAARARRPLPPQRQRVPRGDARRLEGRAAPFNVNYRYVASELAYLLADSRVAAVVYHGAFADTLAEVLPDLPGVRLLLQVDDGSGAPLLPGALAYEEALAAATPAPQGLSPDDRYILYTGGTTGMPKGVLWRQGDFGHVPGRPPERGRPGRRGRSRSGLRRCRRPPSCTAPPTGTPSRRGCRVAPSCSPTTPPASTRPTSWACARREAVSALQIVGDAFARPLLDELDAHSTTSPACASCCRAGRRSPPAGRGAVRGRRARPAGGRRPGLVGDRPPGRHRSAGAPAVGAGR